MWYASSLKSCRIRWYVGLLCLQSFDRGNVLVTWCNLRCPSHQGCHRPKPPVVHHLDILFIHGYMGCEKALQCAPPRDPSISGSGIVGDVLAGALAGVFLAAPAFAVWQDAKFNGDAATSTGSGTSELGLPLGKYISFEGSLIWRRFTAIFP